MKPSAILEAALYATDLAAAEQFYGTVLGLPTIAKAENRHVFFRCGDGVVLIFDPRATSEPPLVDSTLPVPPHGATGPGHLCFAATNDEIDRWKERLRDAGVAIEAELDWPGGGRSLYFRDPFGNSLEFAEPRIWGMA